MGELVEWLRGVLADDERAAQTATPGHWGAQPGGQGTLNDEWEVVTDAHEPSELAHYVVYVGYEGGGATSEQNAAHIARHDPAAVLADIEAKRAVLDATVGEVGRLGDLGPLANAMAEDVVRTLASAYRHRPGWKSSWE